MQKALRASVFEYLENFVSVKREMRGIFLYEMVEREIQAPKIGVAFSNRNDFKRVHHAPTLACGVRPRLSSLNRLKKWNVLKKNDFRL